MQFKTLWPIFFACTFSIIAFSQEENAIPETCQVEMSTLQEPGSLNSNSLVNDAYTCENGQRFQIREHLWAQRCSGSQTCPGLTHCMGGKCVPKDLFHQCGIGAGHGCQLPEKCVHGVCK